MADKAAVVVVTYQSSKYIQKCLDSFVSDPAVGSVVVIDSGSADEQLTRQHLKKYANVQFVGLGKNVGFGASCNRGVAMTVEPIVVLLNPDTELHKACVTALVAAMNEPQNDQVAVIGPLVKNPDGTEYPSARIFPSLLTSAVHAFLGIVAPGNRFSARYLHSDRPAEWISGTAMAVRRRHFESVGGFDEQFFMYVEDVDLCWRLGQAKLGVAQISSAVVTHHIGGSSQHRRFRMVIAHHRSLWRFAKRQATGATDATGVSKVMLPVVAGGLVARCGVLLAIQLMHRGPAAARHQ